MRYCMTCMSVVIMMMSMIVSELLIRQWLKFLHVVSLEALTGSLQYELDFSYCDYREVFSKQEEAGEEQTEGTHVETNFWPGWTIVAPAGWQVVTVQGSTDDYETLEPHTDVYND